MSLTPVSHHHRQRVSSPLISVKDRVHTCTATKHAPRVKRDAPHCRTQDPGGGVGSRYNSSHFINCVPPEEPAYTFVKLQPVFGTFGTYGTFALIKVSLPLINNIVEIDS